MRQRATLKLSPRLEGLEEKQLPSASVPTTPSAQSEIRATAQATHAARATNALEFAGDSTRHLAALARNNQISAAPLPRQTSNVTGVTMDRITNPTPFNAILRPPFQQVMVQSRPPKPGQTYNVLFISVYNGTKRTFNASDNLTVKLSNQAPGQAFPVLTGSEQWKPGQRMVFYVLSKQYYPATPVVSAGFQFNFVNPQVTAIPGPSGIFLRLKYNPATFNKVLDQIVAYGPGSKGHELGLADTSIWEIIPANSNVIPL
ncbi:hypothetical protein [Singulisphaera sp. PoT]|uniref:hypothetical protein n=1 Tax=Singulisphaera sp. PoT TaxID=3411797 RepID=UPI003BF49C1C